MRISDWSSDVCSSDLHGNATRGSGDLLRLRWARCGAPDSVQPAGRFAGAGGIDSASRGCEPRSPDPTVGQGQCLARSAGRSRQGGGLRACVRTTRGDERSEEHTSELQSLKRNSYAVFCLKKKREHKNKYKKELKNIHTTKYKN